MSVKISDAQMQVLINIIGAVETGGQVYGSRRYNDYTNAYTNSSAENSITIGAFQEFRENAKALLQDIKDAYPNVFEKYDNAGIASDLKKSFKDYNPSKTSAKAKAIVNIINSEEGRKIQDIRIVKLLKNYIAYAESLGVTDVDALFVCANYIHQGGERACKRIIGKTTKPYTLDKLYKSSQSDTGNQVGAYRTRQNKVYQWLKEYLPKVTTDVSNNKGDNKMAKLKGIDISEHQGSIDFTKVKKDGIQFVIIREGRRQVDDDRFFENVKGCKNNSIPILGVYHFCYALDESQALAEAKYCVNNVKKAGLGKDTIIFYDFEYDTVTKAKNKGVTLTSKHCNAFTKVFCEYVEKQGYKAGIYCNNDYYNHWYDTNLLKKYVFWLADYTGEPDHTCAIQQYTSKGKVNGINGNVDMNYYFGTIKNNTSTTTTKKVTTTKKEEVKLKYSRNAVVNLANSWVGRNEYDGSHKMIIDIYNSQKTFPRNTKMQYDWAWCACTWSALAVKLGYQAIMPIEISCYYIIEIAKRMGCWNENDNHVPSLGDAIIYDWDDNGVGDNHGNPDHIGTVVYVSKDSGYMVIVEGNYSNSVKKRTISLNGRYIRGFITPKYDSTDTVSVNDTVHVTGKDIATVAREVIAGQWGNGDERKNNLKAHGYDYDAVQKKVNEILNGTASKPTVVNTDALKKGDTGNAVKEMQKMLIKIGYSCGSAGADGDFGNNTESALKAFQKASKLTVDGVYGTQTKNKLTEAYKAATKPNTKSTDTNKPVAVKKQVTSSCYARGFDKTIAGTYKTTADLYMRNDAGTNKRALCLIPKGTEVACYGYYNVANGVRWYYIQFVDNSGTQYTGFSSSKYLKLV